MLKYLALILATIILIKQPAAAQNQVRFSDIKPGMTNPSIEKQAIWLANRREANYTRREEYHKAVIISNKWEPDPDKNGFYKGCELHIELYGEMPNGKCIMADFTFIEKLLPNETYSKVLDYGSVGDMVYVECE